MKNLVLHFQAFYPATLQGCKKYFINIYRENPQSLKLKHFDD